MSREEIAERLSKLRNEYPSAFIEGNVRDVTGTEIVETSKERTPAQITHDKD